MNTTPPKPTIQAEKKKYVLVNIGCIECGVSSAIVGVFNTEKEASDAAQKCDNSYFWREGGQNHFTFFELPEVGVINPEYKI